MIKNTLLILLLGIFYTYEISAQENENIIIWEQDRKLDWEDFKGRTVGGISRDNTMRIAVADTEIKRSYNYKGGKITFEIYSYFDSRKSWAKAVAMEPDYLQHLQLHFDITELYARLFKQELSRTKFKPSFEHIKKKYDKLDDKIQKELDRFQNQFDKETSLPRNLEREKMWVINIAEKLEELKEFAEPKLIIELK